MTNSINNKTSNTQKIQLQALKAPPRLANTLPALANTDKTESTQIPISNIPSSAWGLASNIVLIQSMNKELVHPEIPEVHSKEDLQLLREPFDFEVDNFITAKRNEIIEKAEEKKMAPTIPRTFSEEHLQLLREPINHEIDNLILENRNAIFEKKLGNKKS